MSGIWATLTIHLWRFSVFFEAWKLQTPFIAAELKTATRKLFRISPFVFHGVKKGIQVWNNTRASKRWKNFHFWVNYLKEKQRNNLVFAASHVTDLDLSWIIIWHFHSAAYILVLELRWDWKTKKQKKGSHVSWAASYFWAPQSTVKLSPYREPSRQAKTRKQMWRDEWESST